LQFTSINSIIAQCICSNGSIQLGSLGTTTTIAKIDYSNEIICIKGKVNVHDLKLFECFLYLDEDAEIICDQLVSVITCEFNACSNHFYTGLNIVNAVSVLVHDCQFYDAKFGIQIGGTHNVSNISSCTFDRNHIGIKMNNERKTTVHHCTFICNGQLLENVLYPVGNAEKTRFGITSFGNSRLEAYDNYFNGIHEGIHSFKSTLVAEHNTFRNLSLFAWTPSAFHSNDGGYAILLLNSIGEQVIDNTIANAYVGVWAESSSLLKVNDNTMDSVYTGIWVNKALTNSKIKQNEIAFTRYGILEQNSSPGVSPEIVTNDIKVSAEMANTLDRIGIYLININPGSGFIYDNTLNIDNGCDGINLNVCFGQVVHYNHIFYSKYNQNVSAVVGRGIALRASDNNYIESNTVESRISSEEVSVGISTGISEGNVICCNVVNTAKSCYAFSGNSDHTKYSGNTSRGNYSNGLRIVRGSYIGAQPEQQGAPNPRSSRNKWYGPSGLDAKNENGPLGLTDRSHIYGFSCQEPYWPLQIDPIQSCPANINSWFISSTVLGTGSCESIPECEIPNYPYNGIPDDYLTNTDVEMAQGLFGSFVNGPELQWDGSNYLFNKILSHTNLIGVNTSIDSFYYANLQSNIYNISVCDSILFSRLLGESSAQINDQFVSTLSDLSALKKDLFFQLLSASSYDSIAILDSMNLIGELIDSLDNQIWQVDSAYNVNILYAKNSANQIIDSITPVTDFEIREKLIRRLFIDLILANQTVPDSIQIGQLLMISQLCPYSDGSLVFWARGILQHFNSEISFDDEYGCSSQTDEIILNNVNVSNEFNSTVYPNPFKDSFVIDLNDKQSPNTYLVTISDLLGIQYFNQEVENKLRINIETNELINGVYMVRIKEKNNNTERITKIIKY